MRALPWLPGDERVEILRSALGDRPRRELRRVARLFRLDRFADGAVLCSEGEVGREAYLIARGHVRVSRGREVVGTAGAGEFVGEMALVDDRPRNATVTAEGTVTVLTVQRADFELLMREPSFLTRVHDGLVGRVQPSAKERARRLKDPTDWRVLLDAARARRIRARRRRLVFTGLALFLLVAALGIAIRAVADRSTPVAVDDAVSRFREASARAAAPAPGSGLEEEPPA
ncbi:MAG TPA: cyclic nucleotide-binding domain-containing protein, partial [Actinomycetota bacterium]|nr:cyclic nucleotide-binding domain-containing protein [Actinomycetota bacterium]